MEVEYVDEIKLFKGLRQDVLMFFKEVSPYRYSISI